ncbi:MAG: MBOAT family protein [Oscillospiraceae bacterium]|nr:MBOAT family protein [Oscillospiraceae bacterium]
MVFSDIFFLFEFLPIFLIFYFAAADIRIKNVVLVFFSLFFYAWGEPFWMVLLIISSITDFLNGRFITRHKGEKKAALGVVSSCVIDLGILAVFKYSGFFMSSVNALTGLDLPVPDLHLPIGISFYTFQSITYVVDVYRGKKAQQNYFGYLLYLSMFFQLVAGPIVRYGDVAREIDRRDITTHDFAEGLCRLVYGLGKKVLIANSVGAVAEQCLTFDGAPVSVLAAWAGVFMYSLQIYFDFSGYSDMAIGMGLMCGFHFPENFDHPYASRSVTEFWRRWHISLGTFFRDYVYIPLGGNRRHQMLNILVVWFLTGLWHGASGNFILWGLYFAFFLVLEKTFLLSFFKKIPALFGHIYTILVALFGWAIFYFTDMGKLLTCLSSMFGGKGLPLTDIVTESALKGNIFIIIIAVLLSAPVYPRLRSLADKLSGNTVTFTLYGLAKIAFLLGIFALSAISLVGDTYSPFLYFRF